MYTASDLINLTGRKYHGQKNHLNYFKKTYTDYSFEEITGSNVGEVIEFFKSLKNPSSIDSEVLAEDRIKTFEVLENYDAYALLGGFIRTGDKIVAFSIGEILGDVLFVHIEKADTSYRGAYQIINNEFAKHYTTEQIEFINREDDAGDAGLRISKQSYHPVEMIDKYIVEVKP